MITHAYAPLSVHVCVRSMEGPAANQIHMVGHAQFSYVVFYITEVGREGSSKAHLQRNTSQRTNSMVKYETTIVDLEASAGGVYQTTVAPVPVKSSRSWIWKTLAAIAFIALCAVAAVFFAWHVTKQNQTELPSYSEKQISTTTALPTQQGKMLKQIAERTKAAIHLHGEHSSSLPNDSLKWVSGVDQSFEQGGLKLDDNKILIPADGLYFVYSQVSYSIQCNPDEDELTQKFLSHSIWRYTDAVTDWKPLQNSAHSVCQSQEDGKTTYSTIYLGAVFKLMQGDKLSTKTSHAAEVEENYAKTFFGVFAL